MHEQVNTHFDFCARFYFHTLSVSVKRTERRLTLLFPLMVLWCGSLQPSTRLRAKDWRNKMVSTAALSMCFWLHQTAIYCTTKYWLFFTTKWLLFRMLFYTHSLGIIVLFLNRYNLGIIALFSSPLCTNILLFA